jgi:hypothetical protein
MQDRCEADFNYLKDIGLDTPIWGVTPLEMNDFVGTEWVADWLDELWCKNYKINIKSGVKRFEKSWDGLKKAVVLVGASPAVLKQIDTLKALDDNFIIVACNSIYGLLIESGVRVDYIMALEARDHIVSDFFVQDDHAELIVSPFVAPGVLDAWNGKKSFYHLGGGRKYSELLKSDGITDEDIGGGNAISTACAWAYKYLSSGDFVLIGTSFCYYEDYYFDKRTTEHVCKFEDEKSVRAVDIYGTAVNVTPSQLMYKTWLENFIKQLKPYANFINATEDGILGVVPNILSVDGEDVKYSLVYLPWINIIPFDMAVKSYRQLFMEAKQNGTRQRL